jgi:hypothetical protein
MLNWLRAHKFPVSVAAALAVAFLLVALSQSFQTCVHANTDEYADHASQKRVGQIIGTWWWCGGLFLNENSGAIGAIATVIMAAFTGTLWWSTESTGRLTVKTVDLAEKQFLMEGQQADLAGKQHGLQRLQYIAANRPRLRIRGIAVEPSGPDGSGSLFRRGLTLKGKLIIANIGATDAIIRDSRYRFYWSQYGLPMKPPLEGALVKSFPSEGEADRTIQGFGSCAFSITCDEELGGDVQGTRRGGGIKLYVMGIIRYSDIEGRDRFMGFCREYVPPEEGGGEGHFAPVTNGDYEFED